MVVDAEKQAAKSTSIIEGLFEVGAHFGYSRTRRHPSFRPFIFGSKGANDIINLEKTSASMEAVFDYVESLAAGGTTILLVGTKPEARQAIEEAAETLSLPYVKTRWVGGTLTNWQEIKKHAARLTELERQQEEGLSMYTKKEQMEVEEHVKELRELFGGIRMMERLPDALFVIDPRYEHIAVREANKLNIPIIALANSDCDLGKVTYPIPANDAAKKSIHFFVDRFIKAYKEGVARKQKQEQDTEVEKAQSTASQQSNNPKS